MGTTRIGIDLDDLESLPEGRVDYAVLDSTTEADLVAQEREDDAEAMRNVAPFARRVRRRTGLNKAPEIALRVLG